MKLFIIKRLLMSVKLLEKIILTKQISKNIPIMAILLLPLIILSGNSSANDNDVIEVTDKVELKTSFIKGNKELPQVLYIVPWQEIKKVTQKPDNMVLHSLYGDVFKPVTPEDLIE
ncbi:hypothetical protein [Colwellia echini]|uniref:Uncharacterized protein n=1 Tax=Colwellia echini TaxID=1982103 RepID=A0ABY3MWN5_9GAMM|nr:hypothetical protein [Colwellia echini]TYK65452.1 hypothetical protein CWS31_010170 [Colwellia echini]